MSSEEHQSRIKEIILIAMMFGYILSAILTYGNYYSDGPTSKEFMARIDTRGPVIAETDWFLFPYPAQFGMYSFSPGIFISFLFSTLLSIIDSIGDYSACSRVSRVPQPPAFAFNRGLTVEGFMSMLIGFVGCCHATVSFGSNIGAISFTWVASLKVFQIMGLIFIFLSIFGKCAAVLMTTPDPVLGSTMFVACGMFIGMTFSILQTIDLNSSRNQAIIGIPMLLGFVVPHFVSDNPDAINSGSDEVDRIIRMILFNSSLVGGLFSCFLDNTVTGIMEERGLLAQMEEYKPTENNGKQNNYEDGPEVYRLPFLRDSFRRSRFAKLIPIFDLSPDPTKN